jgi:hypothetical protein
MSCLLKDVAENGVTAPSNLKAYMLQSAKGSVGRKRLLIILGSREDGFLNSYLLKGHFLEYVINCKLI